MKTPESLSVKKKDRESVFSEQELKNIRKKLSDSEYINNALYCLASLLTDRLLD